MKKKWFLMTAIAVVVLLVTSSCFSLGGTPAEKQPYPTGTELYPAIYGTFSELYPNARYLDIDFYNNKYVLTGITGYAITTPLSYDMTVQLSQTGEIDISYANIYSRDEKGWSRVESFGFYNFNQVASTISAKMVAIANNQADFDRHERAAMADIKFVYTIMKDFTGLAFGDFIEKYAKGSIFNISGPISDVRESSRVINGTTYRYLVTLSQNLVERNANLYFSSLLGDIVYCRFYTNQSDVIRLSRTAVLSVQGTLIGASQGSIGTGISLEMVDIR
ncbi:MAG: hypothetical protein LBI28_06650 [Treponema sp.]|jgi:hypothetical protein|nr:hypothetical protein [Treponema sp.]